jgi:hypothetical protein
LPHRKADYGRQIKEECPLYSSVTLQKDLGIREKSVHKANNEKVMII